MRIAIVTLVGNFNYGNVLQMYALQTTLQRLGHEVVIINRRANYPPLKLFLLRLLSVVKCAYRIYIRGDKDYVICNPFSASYNTQRNTTIDYAGLNYLIRSTLDYRIQFEVIES